MKRCGLCMAFFFSLTLSLRADVIFTYRGSLEGFDDIGGPAAPFCNGDVCPVTNIKGLSSSNILLMTVDYALPYVYGPYTGKPTSWSYTDGVTIISSTDAYQDPTN